MRFKNPQNGYIEEKSAPWLWVLLVGFLYFVASGIWTHALVNLLLSLILFGAFGAPGTLFVILMNIIYAIAAPSIIRSHYLRRGWEQAD